MTLTDGMKIIEEECKKTLYMFAVSRNENRT